MPNWCSNVVTFSGDKNQIKQVLKLFRELGRKGKKQMLGQLPDFISKEQPHFFDIYLEKGKVFYLSKWKPNNDALREIAHHFELDFNNRYSEMDMDLFGEASYTNGRLLNLKLDSYDLQMFKYNREGQVYVFQGNLYEDLWQVYIKLLERKKSFVDLNLNLACLSREAPEKEMPSFDFRSTSNVSLSELTNFHGYQPKGLDLALKYAEQKNFCAAREVFDNLDEANLISLQNYLTGTFTFLDKSYYKDHQYLALKYFDQLFNHEQLDFKPVLRQDIVNENRPHVKR